MVCGSLLVNLRFGDILFFEYHLDEDTDKHSNYSELYEEVVQEEKFVVASK